MPTQVASPAEPNRRSRN